MKENFQSWNHLLPSPVVHFFFPFFSLGNIVGLNRVLPGVLIRSSSSPPDPGVPEAKEGFVMEAVKRVRSSTSTELGVNLGSVPY